MHLILKLKPVPIYFLTTIMYIYKFGVPLTMHTDQGKNFDSFVMERNVFNLREKNRNNRPSSPVQSFC